MNMLMVMARLGLTLVGTPEAGAGAAAAGAAAGAAALAAGAWPCAGAATLA
jgi:hypothetical protein